jgi:hypothetical protein
MKSATPISRSLHLERQAACVTQRRGDWAVIRDIIPYELGGAVHYGFASDGIRCKLEVGSTWVLGERQSLAAES